MIEEQKKAKDKSARPPLQRKDKEEGLKARIGELENNWRRALADYKNLEKRVAEERLAIVSFANATLILKILTVLDNLEMLDKHVEDAGLKLTVKEFKQILTAEGVEGFFPAGEDFDSGKMEAVEMVDGEEGKVVEVLQKGYKLKGKVLRPARVKVGKGGSK